MLERAGIADIADRRVGACSGGQQQRLRFALALLPDPDLLLLDEPTTGMDVEGRRDFWAAIRADAARGRTVLFATHYLDEADAYADRIVLVRRGRIVADGTPAHVKSLASGRTVRATLPDADQVALLGAARGRVGRGARRRRPAPHHATPTRPPATSSPRRTRATSRSPPTASRTPSSPSPADSETTRRHTDGSSDDHSPPPRARRRVRSAASTSPSWAWRSAGCSATAAP